MVGALRLAFGGVVTVEDLSGWGNVAGISGRVASVAGDAVAEVVRQEVRLVARGLGRAYGDCAYVSGGLTLKVDGSAAETMFDGSAVEVSAGTSLDDLIRQAVPRGLFVPVSPGTRFVTVGGAIAADIHGKNHHRDGSFGNHCEWIELVLASGETVRISPRDSSDLYWATVGGMGLTGVVIRARVNLLPIATSSMIVRTSRHGTLSDLCEEMIRLDPVHRYTVAWVDTIASGSAFGRSVLWAGDHAAVEELPRGNHRSPLAFDPRQRLTMPKFPTGKLISPWSVRMFNAAWFGKAPKRVATSLQSIPAFFHPLDGVAHWNRIYGPSGFIQLQFVVPDEKFDVVEFVLRRMAERKIPAFLSVLKRFGSGNSGFLSFPRSGWTLAVDIPAAVGGLAPFLDEIDDTVAANGGRIYLAKDSRMRPHHLPIMYPALERFKDVRRQVDPSRKFASNMSRRLGL